MKLFISLGIFYPSQVGGPSNTLYWLAKTLVSKGVEVDVVVTDSGVSKEFASRDKWIDVDGIRVRYCSGNGMVTFVKSILFALISIKNCDVVMLSSVFYKPNFFISLWAILIKRMVIWSPRGELFWAAINKSRWKLLFVNILKVLFAKRVIFHATSEEECEAIRHFMGSRVKTVLIPNYMELPKKIEREMEREYLLYVGRIAPIKALDRLIKGVSLSSRFMNTPFTLILAGDNRGDYYESLLLLVDNLALQQKVVFKGMVVEAEKEQLYAEAKVTLLVSHTENFGNVVIESLAQGTPVIASKGTPWQSLHENNTGFWIDNSPESIAAAIDHILDMSEVEYNSMRKQSESYCKKEFDVIQNAHKWLEIMRINT